jgi:predicted ester cyclase
MEQQNKNKEFTINYFNAISGMPKPRKILEQYITDETLMDHIQFFEAAFPKYELYMEEMTAEGNMVVVKAHIKATHLGDLGGIAPTFKSVEFPFVIRYEIENNKIVSHWMLADQMVLMEQLGVVPSAVGAH